MRQMTQSLDAKPVTRVWIAPGCIVCNLCEDTCPEVFDVRARTCEIRAAAERQFARVALRIVRAAEECPVDVIRVGGHNEPP
jgi:ferredoxin